jgi:hypothetical protein
LWLTAGGQSQDSHQTEKEKQAHRIQIAAAHSLELFYRHPVLYLLMINADA